MLVSDERARRAAGGLAQPEPRFEPRLRLGFSRHVGQADQGCDFDFLAPEFGRAAGEPDIF